MHQQGMMALAVAQAQHYRFNQQKLNVYKLSTATTAGRQLFAGLVCVKVAHFASNTPARRTLLSKGQRQFHSARLCTTAFGDITGQP
jgi:hypothetical protein